MGPSDPVTRGVRRNLRPVRAIVERATRTILGVVGAGPAGRFATTHPYPLLEPRRGVIVHGMFSPRKASSLLQP